MFDPQQAIDDVNRARQRWEEAASVASPGFFARLFSKGEASQQSAQAVASAEAFQAEQVRVYLQGNKYVERQIDGLLENADIRFTGLRNRRKEIRRLEVVFDGCHNLSSLLGRKIYSLEVDANRIASDVHPEEAAEMVRGQQQSWAAARDQVSVMAKALNVPSPLVGLPDTLFIAQGSNPSTIAAEFKKMVPVLKDLKNWIEKYPSELTAQRVQIDNAISSDIQPFLREVLEGLPAGLKEVLARPPVPEFGSLSRRRGTSPFKGAGPFVQPKAPRG